MKKKITRFRPIIEEEIARHKYPFPPELIMALISVESGGKIGEINTSSGASGLMQIMPIALKDFNLRSGQTPLTMQQLQSTADTAAHDQIRIGMWLLSQFWRGAYRFLKRKMGSVQLSDLVRIADSFYAAGPHRMRQIIGNMPAPTFDNAYRAFPNSNALGHAKKVWDRALGAGVKFDEPLIWNWLKRQPSTETTDDSTESTEPFNRRPAIDGVIFALILIGIGWALFSKGFNHGNKKTA